MAEVTPIDIQKHLGGMDYPASKTDIVEQARASGADETILSKLESLPDREYDGPNGVMKELGGQF